MLTDDLAELIPHRTEKVLVRLHHSAVAFEFDDRLALVNRNQTILVILSGKLAGCNVTRNLQDPHDPAILHDGIIGRLDPEIVPAFVWRRNWPC